MSVLVPSIILKVLLQIFLSRHVVAELLKFAISKIRKRSSTRLAYTGLRGGLEYRKIETRLRGEMFESVEGEYAIEKL